MEGRERAWARVCRPVCCVGRGRREWDPGLKAERQGVDAECTPVRLGGLGVQGRACAVGSQSRARYLPAKWNGWPLPGALGCADAKAPVPLALVLSLSSALLK